VTLAERTSSSDDLLRILEQPDVPPTEQAQRVLQTAITLRELGQLSDEQVRVLISGALAAYSVATITELIETAFSPKSLRSIMRLSQESR
jgi:hypothetical protein